MAKEKKEPDERAQRIWELYGVAPDHQPWVSEVVDLANRQDSVPCLNGVAVGQHWRNIHTGSVECVESIWLAGVSTHTAHYESIEFEVEEGHWRGMGQSLWSLVEHWELVEAVEPHLEKLLIDDQYGKMEVEVMSDPWEAVDPQPYVWPSRDTPGYDEKKLCLRVKHCRPHGGCDEIKARRKTYHVYDNGVVLLDGVYVFKMTRFYKDERTPQEMLEQELERRSPARKKPAPAKKRKARSTTTRAKARTGGK